MKKLFLLQVLYLFISNTSYSQCGILDNTFGISGKVSTTNFPPYIMKPYMVLIQPDQKIIAAGEARDVIQSGQYFSVVRYNTDGALDSSFGTNGIVIPNINPDTGFWVSDIGKHPTNHVLIFHS